MGHGRLWIVFLAVGCLPDAEAPVAPGDDHRFVVEVPIGATANSLAPELVEQGLLTTVWHWKWFLRSTDANCLKAGRFEVQRSMSMRTLLDTLCGVPLSDDVPFAVLEGWRIKDVDLALAKKGLIEPGTYAHLANTKAVPSPFSIESPTYEGYLYPETYQVSPDRFRADDFILRQLQTFESRFLSEQKDGFGDRTLHDIVVMASMLEREEPMDKNRPLVAGILWKRIDADVPLGVDATSRYTLDQWNDRRAFLKQLRDPDDPYNTRLNGGLPPTAIGSTTLSSLAAAIAPVASEYWYYLHDASGELHPAKNGDEHEENRRKHNVY